MTNVKVFVHATDADVEADVDTRDYISSPDIECSEKIFFTSRIGPSSLQIAITAQTGTGTMDASPNIQPKPMAHAGYW